MVVLWIATSVVCVTSGTVALPHAPAVAAVLLVTPIVIAFAILHLRRRAEAAVIASILSRIPADEGFEKALEIVLDDLARVFGASAAMVMTRERESARSIVWELVGASTEGRTIRCRELAGGRSDVSAAMHPLLAPFGAGTLSGSVILMDPAAGCGPRLQRLLTRLIAAVAPALASAQAMTRARAKAVALDRANLARELHDGAIQSLIVAKMQVESLSRRVRATSPVSALELSRVHDILQHEILNLRDFMTGMKPIDVGPQDLASVLEDVVDRFGHDSGIESTFAADATLPALSRAVCAQIVRIVREALVNVRKHSHAGRVHVKLAATGTGVTVSIADNGDGFPFDGRVTVGVDGAGVWSTAGAISSQTDRPVSSIRVPREIRDAIRALGGQLTIDSKPGQGARLQIVICVDPPKPSCEYEGVAS